MKTLILIMLPVLMEQSRCGPDATMAGMHECFCHRMVEKVRGDAIRKCEAMPRGEGQAACYMNLPKTCNIVDNPTPYGVESDDPDRCKSACIKGACGCSEGACLMPKASGSGKKGGKK